MSSMGRPLMPARLVDAVHRHLHAHERGLAAGRRRARQGLERAELEGLGLAEGGPPRARARAWRRRARRRRSAPIPRRRRRVDLAAVPEVFASRPALVLPAFRHRSCSSWLTALPSAGRPCGRDAQGRRSATARSAAVKTSTVLPDLVLAMGEGDVELLRRLDDAAPDQLVGERGGGAPRSAVRVAR